MILPIDFETRSAVDIKKAGAHRYAEDPTTDIWCACYAFEDGPVLHWRPGDQVPRSIAEHVEAGGTIAAWNASFERLIWTHILGPRYSWPVPRLEQFDDTAAWAAAMGLPRNLGDAAKAMGLPEEKDDVGRRLMLQMAKPRKPRKGQAPGLYWWDDEDRIARLVAYCKRDVEAERALRRVLLPLSAEERETWLFDQRMNDRGVRIDVDLVRAMLRVVEQAKGKLDVDLAEVTGYDVLGTTKVSHLTAWLQTQGETIGSLAKAELAAALKDPAVSGSARRALEIRQEAAKASTAKLNAMLACVCADGRARGLHLYHGAGTGRWSGKLIQTQNMPRGYDTKDPRYFNPEKAAADFLRGDAEWISLLYDSPMSDVAHMLRACLVASPGHRLLAADFSAIEGRVTAWVAGEAWKLEAFREEDRGGPGIYELTAASILNKHVAAITKAERQAYGKVPELALGFQGGVVAFHSMAKIYRVDMAEAYEPLAATTDPKVWSRAEARYEECLERQDTGTDVMSREAWVASEVTKVLWRQRHPATVALWKALEEAAFDAVLRPGHVCAANKVRYLVRRGFLWCRLPSGRTLAYGAPKIQERKTPWGEKKAVVTCLGVDSVTKRWQRYALYGGLATENVVQAIARDCLRDGMLNAERAGYPIVLTVHDEAVADVPMGVGSLAEFEELLCRMAPWADGLPVVAAGYEALRYRKD